MLATGGAPQANHGAGGDVECAVSFAGEFLGALEDVEEFVADFHRLAGGSMAEAVELAAGFVVGKNSVELLDARVGLAGDALGGGLVGRVKLEMKVDSHFGVDIFKTFPRRVFGQTAATGKAPYRNQA